MKRSFGSDEQIIDGRLHVFHGGRWLPVPSGGDGTGDTPDGEPTPSDPNAVPAGGEGDQAGGGDGAGDGDGEAQEPQAPTVPEGDAIQSVEEAQLRELHGDLDTYRVERREAQDVDQVRWARSEQERIVNEINRRRAEAQRVRNELAELDEQEVPALPESEPVTAGAGASAAQLAAVRGQVAPQGAGVQQPPAAAPARPRVALQAAAGAEVARPGQEMDDEALGAAIERAKRGRGRQVILASIAAFDEMDSDQLPDLLNADNSTRLNDDLIDQAVADWYAGLGEREPLQASARQGTICGPFDNIREIPDAFVTRTPVTDIFPSRPAGRGGFNYTPSGTLADVDGAVTFWSLHGDGNDQDAVDPDDSTTWKPCIDFDCPPSQEAVVEAIVTCVQYPITLDMSAPERVRNLNNAVGALRARQYEGKMLQRIDKLSHGYHFTGDYGALPSFVEAINRLLPNLNWWNRQEQGQYDLIIPPGAVELLRIDRANRAYGVEAEVADVLAYLTGSIDVRRVVMSLDASISGEPGTPATALSAIGNQAGAMPHIPDIDGVHRVRLVDPAAAIYASTGEMNAGVLRDANLVRQNRTGYFTEQFFFLEKHGPQPWATIDIDLCPNGARAGLLEPYDCAVQS